MIKKLYRAESLANAVFIADSALDEKKLNSIATQYIKNEMEIAAAGSPALVSIKVLEVKDRNDLPEGWSSKRADRISGVVWGDDRNISVEDWFAEKNLRIQEIENHIAALNKELDLLKGAPRKESSDGAFSRSSPKSSYEPRRLRQLNPADFWGYRYE